MTTRPENPLEEALMQARTDVLAQPLFYQRLMSEPIFVVGQMVEPAGDGRPGMNIAIMRHNGRDFHPIFSSLARLRTVVPADVGYFTTGGREFFLRTKGAHFILNPNSEMGKAVFANEIAFWIDPSARARRKLMKNPPQAIMAPPHEEPRVLIEALKVLFKHRQAVVSCFLLDVSFSDRDEPVHPLLVLETDRNWSKITGEISELAGAVAPDLIIDIVPFDPTDESVTVHLKDLAPFYRRL